LFKSSNFHIQIMKSLPKDLEWHIKYREVKSRKESSYIARLLRHFGKRNGSVLEVACGNGRLHPFLRKEGFKVFGLDNSSELIDAARKRSCRHSKKYFLCDMRNFKIKKKFDVIISWFTSFGYYNDKINLKILTNMKNHLSMGGLLFLDIPNKKSKLFRSRRYSQKCGKFLEKVSMSVENSRGQTFWKLEERFYSNQGKDSKLIKSVRRKVRIYDSGEIQNLLSKSGFETLKIFRTGTFDKARSNSRRMLIVARPR
jgi:SAM-dependent methyltransferase